METKRLRTDPIHLKETVATAAAILKAGGTVAIPTETVYGLAASAYDEKAVKKVFTAKGRPQDNPLIVHIADFSELDLIARDIPAAARRCAEAFWPGPFTMVLKRGDRIPPSVSAGLDTVAVRMPDNPVARAIISASGLPLAAPSANLSGKPSPTKAATVIEDLDGKIDAVVQAGDCTVGVESTVISFCTDPPRLLRPGAVTPADLHELVPDLVIDRAVLAEPEAGEKVASPGMKYKHYAPNTETVLVKGGSAAFAAYVNAIPDCAAVCFEEETEQIKVPKLCYGSEKDAATLAQGVFSALRLADGLSVKRIYVHAPSTEGIGLAVYNRLLRAAAFRVVTV